MEVTKTQIDRLGERLKKGSISEADLRLLDLYRRSFSEAYEIVIGNIRKELALEPTGRPEKSTTSISDKLQRESIRLTQIQDIAGCRLIMPDIANQEVVIQSLTKLFEHTTIVDRRKQPSHGYRAVHVIVNYRGKLIEIQVRTALQQLWAEFSEKFSDVVDPAIKYGAGNETIQKILADTSTFVIVIESVKTKIVNLAAQLSLKDIPTNDLRQELVNLQEELNSNTRDMFRRLHNIIESMKN